MNKFKKVLSLLLLLSIVFSICSCGLSQDTPEPTESLIPVPDVYDTDENTARNVFSSNGLIPQIEYEYDDNIEIGNVIRTDPSFGSDVKKNEKIIIYVSKGPSYIESKDSRIRWYNVSSTDDEWEFYSPYIEEEILYIECHDVMFSVPVKWKDNYKEGEIIGEASINDTFDKTVPCSAEYKKQSWKAKEKQDFVLKIPLTDLNETRPTEMNIRLYACVNGEDKNIEISFTMTW